MAFQFETPPGTHGSDLYVETIIQLYGMDDSFLLLSHYIAVIIIVFPRTISISFVPPILVIFIATEIFIVRREWNHSRGFTKKRQCAANYNVGTAMDSSVLPIIDGQQFS